MKELVLTQLAQDHKGNDACRHTCASEKRGLDASAYAPPRRRAHHDEDSLTRRRSQYLHCLTREPADGAESHGV